ncbi:hypothetical protein GIB67_017149 [Kingdonia uniflora]|uniref:Uncharacterized protein n=1 Tax=Kingdonia uniflora TaxID=39325 RepID=A0A7J7NX02_9MAGN|nr:hypothetical protein GIB67_017149 [Kingdonia uniflora]
MSYAVITAINSKVSLKAHRMPSLQDSLKASIHPFTVFRLIEESIKFVVNSEAKKYKTAPLQHRDLLKKLFDGLSATGDFAWSSVIPSYDAPISPVREPTHGSTSRSRTPAPQSNRRRSVVAVQPLEPTELVNL